MTAEDEEFNRIEMESRIKQEYVRSMRKRVDDDFDTEYAKTMTGLMDELALARVLIRELGDRLAKLEKTEPVKMLEYICVCGKGMKFESKDGIVAPQRTWFGLTDEEKLIANQMWRVMDADGFIKAIEAKLKEKNT
jgi:hypothetical protein